MGIRVLLVTTWDTACGIAEHSAYLKDAVEKTDSGIEVFPVVKDLDPAFTVQRHPIDFDLLHLNYQASLHSRWNAHWIDQFRASGRKVVVTYHDTGVPNSEQCLSVCNAADAVVIHESCADLPKAHYWRQPIPTTPWFPDEGCRRAYPIQPVIGSVGFPFPWKNYDLLAEASAAAGWAMKLYAPNATEEQITTWRRFNPYSTIYNEFEKRDAVLMGLSGCDATAFLYATANTGTSAAIRQGIAARKPVLATLSAGCRQFRDLDDSDAHQAITWLAKLDVDHIVEALCSLHIGRVDPQVVRLANLDSWERNGQRYAALYRSLL